jgi:HEAT repeat protein
MELWNRALTAVLYVLGGLLAGVLLLSALWGSGKLTLEFPPLPEPPPAAPRSLSAATADSIALRSAELRQARDQIVALRQQVEQQVGRAVNLRRQVQILEDQNQRLRHDNAEILDWFWSLVASQNMVSEPRPDEGTAPAAEARREPDSADLVELASLMELEELRSRLESAPPAEPPLGQEGADLEAQRIRMQEFEAIASVTLLTVGTASIPALLDATEHPDPAVRRWAIRTIRRFGPAAEEAIPVLTSALEDEDELVRNEAEQALEAIRD